MRRRGVRAICVGVALAAAALPSAAFGLPAAPTGLTVNPAGVSKLAGRNIAWTAVAPEAGCDLTGYSVTVSHVTPAGAAIGPTALVGTTTAITLPSDGTYRFSVHAIQAEPPPPVDPAPATCLAPGAGPDATSGLMTLDTTQPGVTLSGGPTSSPTSAAGPFTFAISSSEPGASLSWNYTGTPGSGTGANATVTAPSSGSYTFTATATDAAGNFSTTSRTFTIDRAPPAVPTISGGPANGSTVNAIPTGYSLSSSGATGFTWTLSGPTPKSGVSNPVSFGTLSDGSYSLTATAHDSIPPLNNTSASSAPRTFTLDTRPPPSPSILGIADGSVVNSVPSFDLGNSEAGVDFSWTLSGPASRSGGDANVDLAPLPADGTYTLRAKSTDGAGNPSNESVRSFRLDRQAPSAPTITPEILSVMNAPPVATIAGGGEPVSYRWQLDGGGVKSTTAINLAGLADGDHTLVAWTIDAAGNESARANRPFKLDRLAPDPPQLTPVGAAVTSVPSVTITAARGTTISWALTGARALSGQGVSPLNPSLGNLPDGEYTLVARARTAAGNTSAPTSVNFRIDTQPPSAPAIISGPASDRGGPKPTFAWAGEAGGSFVWQITRGDLVVQGPSTTADRSVRVAELLTGRFIFHVQQVDPAGNLGPESQFAFAIRNRSVSGKVAGKPLLAKPYGPLFPNAGRTITGRSQLVLSWTYSPGLKKSRLFNVQIFDENGKKIHSGFPRKNRYRIPAALATPGRRLYWQVWPYWGTKGYARKPLGVSYINISRKLSKLAAER